MTNPLVLAAGSMLDCTASEMMAAAAGAGFDGVGLRLSGEHAGDPAVLRGEARTLGLTIHDTEVHRIGPDAGDPTELLDRSAALGVRSVLVVSDLDDRATTRALLTRVASLCRERSLRPGLEYMAWTDPCDPIDAIDMARESGCALVVDLLHHVRLGYGPDEIEAIVDSGTLGWVQLCDAPIVAPADLIDEARHHRLPPGLGALPLRELLAPVPAATTISVEVQSDELLSTQPAGRARLLHDSSRALLVHGSGGSPRTGT